MSVILKAARSLAAMTSAPGAQVAGVFGTQFGRGFFSAPVAREDKPHEPEDGMLADDLAHATGLERAEMEGAEQGVDIFGEPWLTAPPGTPDNPVEVQSFNTERIIGVTDPDDDCHVMWGVIKVGEPPKQIIENGEFYVLKQVEAPEWAIEEH